MRLYILMALVLLIALLLLYIKYHRNKDTTLLLRSIGVLGIAIFFTYISKVILVHKPLFVVHLSFVLLSWVGVFYYLFKERLILWFLLSPVATVFVFVIEALFFREHG